jgi:iron(III) transport system substrate-binding protein
MKKRLLLNLILILLIISPAFVFSGGKSEGKSAEKSKERSEIKIENWEQAAEMGKYRPETEDWAEIERKAREEGTIVVYSISSRVFDYARTFYNKYGIKVEANDISTPDLLDKLRREQASGIYHADIVMSDSITDLYNEFEAEGMLYKFYPSDLQGVMTEDALNQPLAVHHYGCKGVLYNTALNDSPPIDSWWDLTRPEWKGKLVAKDPSKSGTSMALYAAFVQDSDTFAKSYKEEFGEDIVLSEGVENAGYEFIKRLLANDLILMSSSDPVISAVASIQEEIPPLGIVSLSKIRVIVDDGLSVNFIEDLKPKMGLKTTSSMAIVNGSQNPNGAKLLMKWMMGADDMETHAGYSPYYTVGNWSPRTDFEEPADQPDLDGKVYYEDPDWLYRNLLKVRDFWVQYQ